MERRPKPGEQYRHFKQKLYQVIGVAVHSETGEELVVYQALYGDFGLYARPLSMFVSEVDHEKYPDVKQKYRFEKVEKSIVSDEIFSQENEKNQEQESSVSLEQTEEQDFYKTAEERTKLLIEFLDCDTYGKKLEYLHNIKKYIDDKMIDDISFSMDFVIEEGELEDRIYSLENALKTFRKFERRTSSIYFK